MNLASVSRLSKIRLLTAEQSMKSISPLSLSSVRYTCAMASKLRPPPSSWDTHIHVTDPKIWPLPIKGNKAYKVETATLSQAYKNATQLGLPNIVFVQTSTYGTDNTWIIEVLKDTAGADGRTKARGVVVIDLDDPSVDPKTLQKWHDVGVRGLRVNLVSVGEEISGEQLRHVLRESSSRIRHLKGWSLHVYLKLAMIPELLPLFEEQDSAFVSSSTDEQRETVSLVIDHIGSPPSVMPPMIQYEGWKELLDLLQQENCYVKVSAPYRYTKDPTFADMKDAVKDLLSIRQGRAVIFASDWPHTRFEATDIRPWTSRCLEWCGEDELLKTRLFRENAERLFGV